MHTLYLSNGLQELACLVFLRRYIRYEIVLIEHDCRYLYKKEASWKNRLNTLLLYVTRHVYIGDRTAQSFRDNAIIFAQSVSIEAAFLPPDASQEQAILATYPRELFEFLKQYDKKLCLQMLLRFHCLTTKISMDSIYALNLLKHYAKKAKMSGWFLCLAKLVLSHTLMFAYL